MTRKVRFWEKISALPPVKDLAKVIVGWGAQSKRRIEKIAPRMDPIHQVEALGGATIRLFAGIAMPRFSPLRTIAPFRESTSIGRPAPAIR